MLTSRANYRGKTTEYNFCPVQIHHNLVTIPPYRFYRSPFLPSSDPHYVKI